MKTKALFISIFLISGLLYGQKKDSIVPFHIGMAFPLSTNGHEAPNLVNSTSIHFLTAYSAGVDGMEVTGFASIVKGDVKGIQASGILNIAEGKLNGLQGAGTVNIVEGHLQGVQGSGIINMANSVHGVQGAGVINMTEGKMHGLQGAGTANVADSVYGMQGSGFVNVANHVQGFQGAGFLNVAKNVEGVQAAGFINIADSCDYPLAPINIIKNGKMVLHAWTNLQQDINLSFKSGGRKTYGVIGIGINPFFKELEFGTHLGLGYNCHLSKSFVLSIEAVNTVYFSQNELEEYNKLAHDKKSMKHETNSGSLNLILDYQPVRWLGITAGPSISYMHTNNKARFDCIENPIWDNVNTSKEQYDNVWLGFTAGVYYRF